MKIAIIYSSKHGTTAKISNTIAELVGNKAQIELYDLTVVANVDVLAYDTILLGTSIYGGHPLPSMTNFCLRNEENLHKCRLFLFVCGKDNDKAQQEIESAYPASLLSHAEDSRFIEGEFLLYRMRLWERLLLRWCFNVKTSEALDYGPIVHDFVELIIGTIGQES